MHNKNIIFIISITQSMIMLSSLDIEVKHNQATWTVTTSQMHVTVSSHALGTRIKSIKGNLVGPNSDNYGEIYAPGIPITMKPFKINEISTVLIWLTCSPNYHTLLINHDDPQKVTHVNIRTLKAEEKDSDTIKEIKQWIRRDPDLKH